MFLYRIEKYSPKALARIIRDGCFPSIPDNPLDGEDTETYRICTATSIQNCLTSLGPFCIATWQLTENGMTLEDCKGFRWKPLRIIVMRFDTKNISKQSVITSSELYRRSLVPDAHITKEHWLLEPCFPERVYVRDLMSVKIVESAPFVLHNADNAPVGEMKLFRSCRWKHNKKII